MAEIKITSGGKGKGISFRWHLLRSILHELSLPGTEEARTERVQNATEVLSKAFETDPTITFLLNSMSHEQRLKYLPKYFSALVSAAALNHASIEEVDDWKSCGVLVPPGYKIDNPFTLLPAGFLSVLWTIGIGGCQACLRILPLLQYFLTVIMQRMLSDLTPATSACKAKALQSHEKYYYVFFLGTLEEARGKGYCSAMVKHYQSLAARDHLPI